MKSWSCYVTLTLTSVVLKKITHEKGGKSNQAVSLHMRKGQRYILQNTIHSIVHWDTSTTLVPHVRENASHTCTHTHNIEHFPCLKFHHVKSHTVPRQFNGLHAKCTTHNRDWKWTEFKICHASRLYTTVYCAGFPKIQCSFCRLPYGPAWWLWP